jgi:DNA-binding cell septation regulator SpoVG
MNDQNTEAAAVIEATPPITMDVTVRPIAPKGNLLGFASVTFNNAVTVTDFKVLRGEEGLYIGMPSKADPGSPSGYTNTARIPDNAVRQQLTEAVVAQYHIEVENLKARVAAISALETGKESKRDGKPPRIADQVKAAAKEAAAHNAALTDPAKEGRVKHAER